MTVAPPPDEIPLAPEPAHPEPPPAVVFMADKPLASQEVEVGVEVLPVKAPRLVSLDIFRGLTILTMIIVNNPGNGSFYEPLEHAPWHGWTLTDLVFPFFLFIVGVAIPFSFAKRRQTESRGEMFLHVWARALSLVLLGLLLATWSTAAHDPVPDGFTLLKFLRGAVPVLYVGGVLALLTPWPWRKVALITPVIVGVLLLTLGYTMHFALHRAYANGLPDSFEIGGGLFYPSRLRFPGVLARIGVCYGVAATIALFSGWRTVLLSFVVLCAGYSVLMLSGHSETMFPDHKTGSLTREDNLARQVDEYVFDRYEKVDGKFVKDAKGRRVVIAKHTYGEYPDPEGLLSTLPAIGTTLIGILIGYGLACTRRTNVEKCASLLAKGVAVTIAGVLLSWWLMPTNKRLWTPSYAVFTAGLAMMTLGLVFYLTDVKGRRAWAWPFKVYGMNAIAAFVLSSVIVKVMTLIKMSDGKTSLLSFCKAQIKHGVTNGGVWWAEHLGKFHIPPLDTPANQSLAYSLAFALAVFVVVLVMYVCRIFVKV
jgi:predicted acyltransferase